jgi:hypothetical protein
MVFKILVPSVNTMRHERIELHITTRVSWILEPFLLAGDKECWENSGLHDCLAIILLHADIRETLLLDSGVLCSRVVRAA